MKQLFMQNISRLKNQLAFHVIGLFFLLLFSIKGQAQVKMPDMISPGDSWGIIDVNALYGGCMQFDTYTGLLGADVQYLKRGMLFVVYDYDGNNSNGLDTRVYMFLPASGVWTYNSPFDVPAASQAKTISSAGLEASLKEVNIGLSVTASEGDVSYNSTDKSLYTYNGTAWEKIIAADNLGNHIATQSLKMGSYSISNDGDGGDGVSFDTDGNSVFGKNVTVNGNFYTPSDERLKTHIETLANVLTQIDHLRGVQFEYKDQTKYAKGPKIGVIAQELRAIYPHMVEKGADGFFKVDYSQLTAVLIQAVKEQQQQIKQQQLEINVLKNKINAQQLQINEILIKLQQN
jgi:hypothetical protein